MVIRKCLFFAIASSVLMGNSAHGSFHEMQIEQVIGGVNGDTSAQAIQLRMRFNFQNQVQFASLWATDATGANRVLLLNIAASVPNSAAGTRVLLATSNFTNYITGTFAPDFTLAAPIPASYLAAGQLRFEQDGGTPTTSGINYWSLSWGGAGFTGSQTGDLTNDSNGNFGPAFGSALPSTNLQALIFPGLASAGSTSNSADYGLSTIPATFTNNAGTSFTIRPLPGDYNGDTHVNAADYTAWRQTYGTTVTAFTGADGNGSGLVDAADYVVWRRKLGSSGAGASTGDGGNNQLLAGNGAEVPEPAAIVLLTLAFIATRLRRHHPGMRVPRVQ